jgi:pyridoxine kinase
MKVPKFDRYFSGTGDLFSALMVAWISKGNSVLISCEKTVNSLHSIIKKTYESNSKELQLLTSKNYILEPSIEYFVNVL